MVEENKQIDEELDKLNNNDSLICSSIDFVSGDIPSLTINLIVNYEKNNETTFSLIFFEFLEFDKTNIILSLKRFFGVHEFNCVKKNNDNYSLRFVAFIDNQPLSINILARKLVVKPNEINEN